MHMKQFLTRTFYLLILALIFSQARGEDWCIYVGPLGNDTQPGNDIEHPVATLQMALRKAREYRRINGPEADITIYISDGIAPLTRPLVIRPEDSGTPGHPLRLCAQSGESGAMPCISGGLTLSRWKTHGKLLVCDVPDWQGYPIDFRQFYVEGAKAVRACDIRVSNDDDDPFEQMNLIRSIDRKNRILYVPATLAIRQIAKQGIGHAEMMLHEMWCQNNLRIQSIDIQGDSAAIRFHEPESTIFWEHPWPMPMTGEHASPFYLTNHLALLDQPGEWYHDVRTHRLYFWPWSEQLKRQMLEGKAEALVPILDNLIIIEGTPDRPVHDIVIEQLDFRHTSWMRPSHQGHVPLQAGLYLTEAYKLRPQQIRPDRNHKLDNQGFVGRPEAAIKVKCSHDITFDSCHLRQLASTGIDIDEYTHDCTIMNCTFEQLGGSAIVAGSFGPEAFESHLPYRPSDPNQRCDRLSIVNNRIDHIGQEDWGTLGIAAGYVSNILIAHNCIQHVPYSGISVGWGWTQSLNLMEGNEVYRNHITHYAQHCYDVAGIYTLSAQPKSYIAENVVDSICHPSYVHDPNHWFYLYCDEGSSFITVQDNWCPAEKFLRNANGPGNTWQNNGPMVSDSIRTNAGIRPAFCLDAIRALRKQIQTRKPNSQL